MQQIWDSLPLLGAVLLLFYGLSYYAAVNRFSVQSAKLALINVVGALLSVIAGRLLRTETTLLCSILPVFVLITVVGIGSMLMKLYQSDLKDEAYDDVYRAITSIIVGEGILILVSLIGG